MRIDKFLSNLKYGTRSEIKNLISEKQVVCNQILVLDAGQNIEPEIDEIEVSGRKVFFRKWVYLMMNKPAGVVSANRDNLHKTVLDLVNDPFCRFDLDLCGRLDLDTEGLLILTNDGEILHQVTNPKKDVEKKYLVSLKRPLGDYSKLEKGVQILDGKEKPYLTRPAKIVKLTDTTCEIIITEGKFHEVKRMFEAIGNEVVFLKRIAIGGLNLDLSLKPGEYKELSFTEIQAVFR